MTGSNSNPPEGLIKPMSEGWGSCVAKSRMGERSNIDFDCWLCLLGKPGGHCAIPVLNDFTSVLSQV